MATRSFRDESISGSVVSVSNATTVTSRCFTGRSRPKTAATATSHENDIVCAVSEARGISPTVGLAFVNISTCEAVLCQLSDTQTYARTCHKIKVFDPSEILFASTAQESKLVSIIKENFSHGSGGINVTIINRKYWSESIGLDFLQQLALPDDLETLKLSAAGKYFAICCFAAAITYVKLAVEKTIAPQALPIKFEASEGAMTIDLSTISALELVQNSRDAKSKDCLFGLLSATLTKMGARCLKSNVLQPSTDTNKIQNRLEAVSELFNKEVLFTAVRQDLQGFVDSDKVLAQLVVRDTRKDFMYMEQSINHVLMLKTFVDSLPSVWQSLTSVESCELQKIRTICHPEHYNEVRELIRYAINEDVSYSVRPTELRNQRVFAIKAGVNGFLDVARQTYKEVSQSVEDILDKLREQHGIALNLKFDPARQYFFQIKIAELEDGELPSDVFINLYRSRGYMECQTLDLIKMNQKLKDAHNEVIVLSDKSIQTLIEEIRSRIHPLFKASEAVAMLDMLAALTHVSAMRNYVRPELRNELAIKSGRHAILEKIYPHRYIPNDVYATQQNRFQVITGCNMSGKSTYIRSIALMSIMAQIGSFVPADYASFPIIHQLFARISTDDSIEANMSTFASEMRETAFILHNIDSHSLVIVDELGRGTSTTDGLCIAIAISEALIQSKALVWFVTHFRDLPRILAERAGVCNLHLEVDMNPDLSRMTMRYKISEGFEERKYYGLALARLMNLPQEVIEIATEVSRSLNERAEARKSSVKVLALAKKRKLALKLKEQLLQARESNIDDHALLQWLKRLQQEFIVRMNAINAEVSAAEAQETEDEASSSVTPNEQGDSIEHAILVSDSTTTDPSSSRFFCTEARSEPVEADTSPHSHIDYPVKSIETQNPPPSITGKPAFLFPRSPIKPTFVRSNGELAHDTIED